MTIEQIKEKLIEYGLPERHVLLYLSLLNQKDQTVFTLAKSVHSPRTTTYQDLESLKRMGLVGVMKKNHVAHWYAEHPRRLVKDAEKKIMSIKEVFPELEALIPQSGSAQSEVRFYIGKESVKEIIHEFYDILEKRDLKRLYTISHQSLQDFLPNTLPKALERKKKLGIYTFLLAPESARASYPDSYTNDSHREVKYLPNMYPFTSTMIICDEHVALFSLKDGEVYATTMTSPAFATMFKAMFMFIWDSLPKSIDDSTA